MTDKQKMINKVLVFDIWANHAHFRRFYTTTSPLTFPVPPRTALCGLIAAIIGLKKEDNEYLRHFTLDKAFIGLKILNPIKKTIIAENLIHTKEAKGVGMNLITKRTQINFEFIKEPKYRIYFYHTESYIYEKAEKMLKEHKTVYTPCLGLSENIANFEFVGEYNVETYTEPDEYVQIHSIIPVEKISESKGIMFETGEYFSVRVPVELDTDRIVSKYSELLFERNGQPITVKLLEPYYVISYSNGAKEKIVFIE